MLFQINGPINFLIKLILTVCFDNAQNTITKNVRPFQALKQEGFEFFPSDRDVSFLLYLVLMLFSLEQGRLLKKFGNKWYPILACDFRNCKISLCTTRKSNSILGVYYSNRYQKYKSFTVFFGMPLEQWKHKSDRVQFLKWF